MDRPWFIRPVPTHSTPQGHSEIRDRFLRPAHARGRAGKGIRVRSVNEPRLNADLLEGIGKEVPRPAVEVGGRDDIVAGTGEGEDRIGGRRLGRRNRKRGNAAFDGRKALLKGVLRRIHNSGVNVAQLLESEQIGDVFGVPELIRRCLRDRHANRRAEPRCRDKVWICP